MGKVKFFVVADVHGFYDQMRDALKTAGFDKKDPSHIFVSLGDLLDRGRQPVQCLNFVNRLPNKRKVLIRGNHEDLAEECISSREIGIRDLNNGTAQTFEDLYVQLNHIDPNQYKNMNDVLIYMRDCKPYEKYINSTINYAEIGNHIFVHGWIPSLYSYPGGHFLFNENWRQADTQEWKQARWNNGMECWHYHGSPDGKTVYCGHWHTSWGFSHLRQELPEWPQKNRKYWQKCFRPFVDNGIVALDACTVYSHIVNCYVIEIDESEWTNWLTNRSAGER